MSQEVDPSELEPELEALLVRLVPDMRSRWQSASEADIEALETIAGEELPRCYQWFLRRLGRGWADIGFGTHDFSAQTIVAGHARGLFPPHEGMMCIAHDTAEWEPQLRYYDLAHPADDDAPVFMAGPEAEDFEGEYESLRALIASTIFRNHYVRRMPHRCAGLLVDDGEGNATTALLPVLEDLGFSTPVATGSLCQLYEDGTHVLHSYRSPESTAPYVLPFDLGAPSVAALRKLLGIICTSTDLVAENLTWDPAL
ncbi:MAG: hypothetical protein AAF799_04190 [Myxococcota bacterium]